MENNNAKEILKGKFEEFKAVYPESIVTEMFIDVDDEDVFGDTSKIEKCEDNRFQVSITEGSNSKVVYEFNFNGEKTIVEYAHALFDDSKECNLLARVTRRKELTKYADKFSIARHDSDLLSPFEHKIAIIDPIENIQLRDMNYDVNGNLESEKIESGKITHYDIEGKEIISKPLEKTSRVPVMNRYTAEYEESYSRSM